MNRLEILQPSSFTLQHKDRDKGNGAFFEVSSVVSAWGKTVESVDKNCERISSALLSVFTRNSFGSNAQATPELVKAQLQVRSLKRKLDSESNAADSQLIRQERLLTDAQRELESALLRLEKVERDRAFLFERSKTFEEELNAERQTALSLRQEQTSTIQSLQKDKGSLVEELAEQRRAAASHRSETARLLQDKEAQIGRLQALVNAKDSKTQEAITSLKSKNELIDQLRTQLGALESQESAPKSGLLTREEGEAMQSQMRENLAHIKKLDSHVLSLKKENAHYKALDLNLSKKDEQVTSLEAQLLTLTQLRKELAETQVENASLKQERAKWASFSGDADPVSMARNLATERFRVAELQELLGVEKAEKAGRESYIKRLEDNAHSFERTLSTIKSQSDKLAIQIRVLERQKRLAERESTFLREQLVGCLNHFVKNASLIYMYPHRKATIWKIRLLVIKRTKRRRRAFKNLNPC